jgi:hypothetical protein
VLQGYLVLDVFAQEALSLSLLLCRDALLNAWMAQELLVVVGIVILLEPFKNKVYYYIK